MRSHRYKKIRTARVGPLRKSHKDHRTRSRLVEVAGALIADKGVDRVTGKEICFRARVNPAAINYHFGGFQGLYASVLCEAHHRLATVESLRAAVAAASQPEAKLEAVIRLIITSLASPLSRSWVAQVLGREIASPSPAFIVLRRREVLPKLGIIRQIVAELMHLPEDHPAVARGCLNVMAPCIMLITGRRRALKLIFPNLGLMADDAETMIRHMVRFALAGLSAVAADVHRREVR